MSTCTMVRGPARGPTAGLRRAAREADAGGHRGQGGDDEGDVLVEVDAQLLRAPIDVLAIDRAREGLVLELLPDRARLETGNDAPRADEGAGRDEARELVARVEAPLEERDAWIAGVVGMGQDGSHDLGRPSSREQDLGALHGMLGGRRMHLVV